MIVDAAKKGTLTPKDKRLMHICQLLGDHNRFLIFKTLMGSQEMCVSQIAVRLGVSVSAVSQHFKHFELLGIVDKNRYGQKICYVLKTDDQLINKVVELVNDQTKLKKEI